MFSAFFLKKTLAVLTRLNGVMILNPHLSACYFLHFNACSRSLNIYDELLLIYSLHISFNFIF